MKQFHNISGPSDVLVSMGKGQVKEMCLETFLDCSKEKGRKSEIFLHLCWSVFDLSEQDGSDGASIE